jgi:hypothetical protein
MDNANLAYSYPSTVKLTNGDRYRGCNITSYDKHGTVEYRYSEGIMDYDKIRALVDLFVNITEYAATHKGNIKVKSPRKKEEKRRFLLKLVGVTPETFNTLIHNTKY